MRITFQTTWAVHFLFFALAILFIATNPMELHFDEAQYWYWSKKPQLAYYSKPALIAYFNYVSTGIFGDTHFGIRFSGVLLSVGTSIFLGLLAKRILYDPKMVLYTVVTYYLSPIFLYTTVVFSTDSLLVFFWAASTYFFWRAFEENKTPFWILAGVSNMLGVMSKYTMFIFPIFTVFYLLFGNKEKLKSKNFLMYLSISLLGWAPIILWNIQNDFVSFKHVGTLAAMGEERITTLSRRFKNLGEFVGGQIAIVGPIFLLLYFQAFKYLKNNNESKRVFLYLLLPSVMVMGYFLFLSMYRHSGSNINWAMFSLIVYPIAMAYFVTKRKKISTFLVSVAITVVIEFLAFDMVYRGGDSLVNTTFPKVNALQRYIGWQELTDDLYAEVEKLGAEKTVVLSNSYHISSNLKFYAKDLFPVAFVNTGGRKNQYDLWNEVKTYENKGYNVIFISRDELDFDLEQYTNGRVGQRTFQKRVRKLDTKKYYIESHLGFSALPFSGSHF